jgi:uncharacterized protein YjiS (DUF1127 family)
MDTIKEGQMTSVSISTRQGAAPGGVTPDVGSATSGLLARILDRLLSWQERAFQRQALASLDDRLLKDIGISRAAADHGAGKPFWQV